MNKKFKYWIQDQETELNPIIWKMFPEENRSKQLATFFHEED